MGNRFLIAAGTVPPQPAGTAYEAHAQEIRFHSPQINSMIMNLEKITANIEGKEYSFTVETIPSDDPAVIYRVVPDNDDKLLDDIINGYIDFDEKGNVQTGEDLKNRHAKEVTDAIWKAVESQIVKEHQS